MNHVIRHIEYLVHRHDCVVLPKWGAFIAHYQPACYDEALGVMYPPVRELSFSSSVDYNDGLLASSIARKESLSFGRASRIVEEELAAMKHQLEYDGEISLGRVGRFIRQDEVSVIFEPASMQSLVSACGFEAFEIKPLLSKVREEAISTGRIEAPRRGRLSRIGIRAIKAAAVVAVAVGVSLVLLRPTFERNDDMASIANVIPGKSSQTSVLTAVNDGKSLNIMVPEDGRRNATKDVTVTEEAMEYSSTVDSEGSVDTEAGPVETANVNTDVSDNRNSGLSGSVAKRDVVEVVKDEADAVKGDSEETTGVRFNASDRYCLVIASLPTEESAQKYIRENGTLTLGILSKDGKYRVYAATGNTTNEALLGKSINGVSADAWVCSMR